MWRDNGCGDTKGGEGECLLENIHSVSVGGYDFELLRSMHFSGQEKATCFLWYSCKLVRKRYGRFFGRLPKFRKWNSLGPHLLPFLS